MLSLLALLLLALLSVLCVGSAICRATEAEEDFGLVLEEENEGALDERLGRANEILMQPLFSLYADCRSSS